MLILFFSSAIRVNFRGDFNILYEKEIFSVLFSQ